MRFPRIVAFVLSACFVSSAVRAQDTDQKSLSTADTRLVVGFEQSAVVSGSASQNFLLDFMLTAPGPKHTGLWFDARLASSPQTLDADVKTFSGAFPGQLQSLQLGNFAQGLNLTGGLEVSLNPNYMFFPTDHEYALEPMFLAGLGLQTPLNSTAPTAVLVAGLKEGDSATPEVQKAFPDIPADTKYIALVPPVRDRFYSQWFVGLRLKTHHLHIPEPPAAKANADSRVETTTTTTVKDGVTTTITKETKTETTTTGKNVTDLSEAADKKKKIKPAAVEHIDAAFPGIIDLTLGQNQSITGGSLHGLVGRVDAFYPFPLEGSAAALYIFGGLSARFKAASTSAPLILATPKQTVPVPGANVAIETIPQNVRDTWRIGIGVDMITLVNGLHGSSDKPDDKKDKKK